MNQLPQKIKRHRKKTIKCGKLYYYPIDCPDIDKFFLRRLFRRFNINYIPFTLRFYERLFLREDHSKYGRLLVQYCKKKGIETVVVQEGGGKGSHPYGHLPLFADYFLCPQDSYQMWIERGMPKEHVRIFRPQKELQDITEILFLPPLILDDVYTKERFLHNIKLIEVIEKFKREQVAFRLYPEDCQITRAFLPEHRVVFDEPKELIKRYKKIYCFGDSEIVNMCKGFQKEYELVDK